MQKPREIGINLLSRWQTILKKYDLLLIPTLACPPANIGELVPSKIETIAMDAVYALKTGKLLLKIGIIDDDVR